MDSNDGKATPPVEQRDPTAEERKSIYCAVGEALARWADIEHALASCFAIAIRTDLLVGQQVFLDMRSFDGKKRMIKKAIQIGKKVWKDDVAHVARLKMLDAAIGRVGDWEMTRNRIAHGSITVMTHRSVFIGGVVTPINLDTTASQEQTLPLAAIVETASNFKSMARLLLLGLLDETGEQFEERTRLFGELPKVPYQTTMKTLLGI